MTDDEQDVLYRHQLIDSLIQRRKQLAPHVTYLTSSWDPDTGEIDIELGHRTENAQAALEEYKTVIAAAFTLFGEKAPALDKYTIH